MAVNIKPPVNDSEQGPNYASSNPCSNKPEVVSALPEGLAGAIIEATTVDVANLNMMRANPFPPGSRAYMRMYKR